MIKFFAALLATTLLLALAMAVGIEHELFPRPSFLYRTLIFLVFGTSLVYIYLFKASKPDFFVQLYLLTMAVKLLAYCGYVLLIILEDRGGAVSNVVFFVITYFLFTALEVGFLYKKISSGNGS